MRVLHDSRKPEYRQPFGAVTVGTTVTLSVDIWDAPDAKATLRLWVDGKGEKTRKMSRKKQDGFIRYTAAITPEEEDIIWYSFLIKDGSDTYRCGACDGRTGGPSQLCDACYMPPSFQLTVSRERKVPDWYKKGIVYQIFPDRFARDENWRERMDKVISQPKNGPKKVLRENWDETPFYDRTEEGRINTWDFYGGSLAGIKEKLPYLARLGVTALYLNPIFAAASNHRYDTADYTAIDPALGTVEDFTSLCAEADKLGISLILDGVFNHTGCDSIYFDKYGNYVNGAYGNEDSPYRAWYRFDDSPCGYESWWGVDDLPNVEENDPEYRSFIANGENSVIRRWLRAGAKGWRLDVADEMPDDFIAEMKTAVLEERPDDGLLIGEVWEDASNKISYGTLRRYLLGEELDAAMNYPFRDGLLGFVTGKVTGGELAERLMSLRENYPREAFYSSLNLIGSHDRPRVLTMLGDAPDEDSLTQAQRRDYRLPQDKREMAETRLWLMALMQMTLPGVPCIYYGDEAGMEGYADPYNRGTYPWGNEDERCSDIYRNAIALRKTDDLFVDGDLEPFSINDDVFSYYRRLNGETVAVLINRSRDRSYPVTFPAEGDSCTELLNGYDVPITDGQANLTLWPLGSAVVRFEGKTMAKPMPRGSGVLCHVTSVPREEGQSFLSAMTGFVDFLHSAGQRYWQILPINPTDDHGSPYAGASAFAGNSALLGSQEELLKRFKSFKPTADYADYWEKNAKWLGPYAMYSALREEYGAQVKEWPHQYRRWSNDLYSDKKLADRAEYYKFCQYLFEDSWRKVRQYANSKGVKIIGDMPMYVSACSADAWECPELFTLTEDGELSLEAGVPPDYFAEDGQLWGNPLYNWDAIKDTGYDWWLRRLERAFSLYDYVRLDHFRGFEAYWAVPVGEKATAGCWNFGPGAELFKKAFNKFGPLPVIAEDLGLITPAVRSLLTVCGFNGADVVQFWSGDPLYGYTPPKGKIAYSGTHDNATLLGWCAERYPENDPAETAAKLMENLYACRADVVIMPLQDVLGLGDEARMNVPGTTGTNWKWRAEKHQLSGADIKLKELTIKTDRS